MSEFNLTIDNVKSRVAYNKSISGDAEMAHAHEDQLHAAFLQHIIENGRKEDADIAKEVLKTNDIDFPRWCA